MPEGHSAALSLQRARAESRLLDNRVAAEKAAAKPHDGGIKPPPFERRLLWLDPQKDQARHTHVLPENEFAEVFVLGQKEPSLCFRKSNDCSVDRPWRMLGHVDGIVARFAKTAYHGRINAFIGDPAQSAAQP
jgi:hypothetical protein